MIMPSFSFQLAYNQYTQDISKLSHDIWAAHSESLINGKIYMILPRKYQMKVS